MVVTAKLQNEKKIYVNMGEESGREQLQEESGEAAKGEKSGQRRDRAVGDKAKERPAEFLECTGGFVQREEVHERGVCGL